MCSEVEAGNFTTLVHSVLLNVGKSVFGLSSFVIFEECHVRYRRLGHFIAACMLGTNTAATVAELYCPEVLTVPDFE
jgi:hypothetical protein